MVSPKYNQCVITSIIVGFAKKVCKPKEKGRFCPKLKELNSKNSTFNSRSCFRAPFLFCVSIASHVNEPLESLLFICSFWGLNIGALPCFWTLSYYPHWVDFIGSCEIHQHYCITLGFKFFDDSWINKLLVIIKCKVILSSSAFGTDLAEK